MIRWLGRGPLLAVLCLCCFAASACAGSDGDRAVGEPVASTSTTTTIGGSAEPGDPTAASSTAVGSAPTATTSTSAVSTTSAAATTVPTTTTSAAPSTDSSTVTTTSTTAPTDPPTTTSTTASTNSPTTTSTTAPTTDTNATTSTTAPTTDTNATTSTTAPTTDTNATTSTTSPAEVAVSPWPSDPRTADDRDWRVRIETSWRHDTDAFTQGLETHGGIIYESTGLYGESRLRALDGPTELRSVAIGGALFGEGLTLVGDDIIQLSWHEGRALRWDRETFELRGEFSYGGEGWGICWDGVRSRLLMSDGTSTLTHRDLDDFAVVARTTIRRNNEPVRRINELECVDGLVVANIWMTNEIIVFDPDSGDVLVSIDAASLATEAGISAGETDAVLNGVAYRGDGKWILGGKNWPLQFLVTLTLN